ncbi:ccr4 associated factor [Ophidiomyces ophidiicola]|nr:ccr4 associated factor [Ophidiomyces ophidiicola]
MFARFSNGRICTRCFLRRRNLFTTAAAPHEQTGPLDSGHVQLTNRGLLSLTGADSTAFLQGLITQNVIASKNRASLTTPFYAGFLNAQGRVLHDVFIYPNHDSESGLEYLIEVDREQVSNLLKHFKKHKLRSKLKFRTLGEEEKTIWAAWDNIGNLLTQRRLDSTKGVISCVDRRAPAFGYRVLSPSSDLRSVKDTLPGQEAPLSSYVLRRILHGIPEGQSEILRESSLPMDSNMDIMGGIDFHKGCYLGQELTIRTHHRGVIRKRILPVQLYGIDDTRPPPVHSHLPTHSPDTNISLPPAGANITKLSASGRGRSAGKFISGIGNVGLSICRLETMTDISLTGESSQYDPDEEYNISWEADPSEGILEAGQVKVKAFVPSWVREYILNGGVRQRTTRDDVQRARDVLEKMEEYQQ